MQKHPKLTEGRIQNVLTQIEAIIYHGHRPMEIAVYPVKGEPIPAVEALKKTYKPFAAGEAWGGTWDTTWFRINGKVPKEWAGKEVIAMVNPGFAGLEGFTTEALVWQNGKPTRALNVNRHDIPVSAKAKGGESVEFYLETAANPNASMGYDNGLMLPDYNSKPLFKFGKAELVLFDREAWHLYFDVKLAFELMKELPDTEPRYGQLLYALNDVANIFYPTDRSTVAPSRAALKDVLGKKNGSTVHQLSAIGHAHIDTAWLWPLRETMRKCARTFSTALQYMKEYPDYIFGCSQAQQYAWMKECYPEIFEGIKAAVKAGQWEPIGSMWIEADCNLSSGESLVRHILTGKQFFKEEFGYETKDVWIPDVFGYCASMPQIMKKMGVDYFLTQKISWSQFNKFPHHTFMWEGIDGTQIFTHFPPADTYNSEMKPNLLRYNVRNFKENDRATRSMFVYGFGDGGGGPTREMIEMARRAKDLEGLPKVQMERVSNFFPKAVKDAKDLPLWVGELYLELHRGTYTTQANNKRGNRKSELLLRDAEFFDALGNLFGARQAAKKKEIPHAVYDVIARVKNPTRKQDLERAWKLLMLNQFHDIIPGSSINWVYKDSAIDYATIGKLCNRVIDETASSLTGKVDTSAFSKPVMVFNSLGHERCEVVKLPNGTVKQVQVPALGYTIVEGKADKSEEKVSVKQSAKGIVVDNGLIRVTFDKDGLISSIWDYAAKREVVASGKRANLFQIHKDYPNFWDAWDIDIHYKDVCEDIVKAEKVSVSEAGPLRVVISVSRKFSGSKLEQNIVINADSRRIDFETKVDWNESHKLLKVAFPVDIRSPKATYEIQYGHLERPTHYNTSWDMARFEVCAQKWADLSERDYGVALLNDCKYGHDIFGNTMRLSLLRAPSAPDPKADLGKHEFTYSLLPHSGDISNGRVIEEAYALNVPLRTCELAAQKGSLPTTQSFFGVDRAGVVVEAIKNAEDGSGVIVRMYEAYGTRGECTVSTSLPFTKAVETDLLERETGKVSFKNGKVKLTVKPFEIITLKFSK